VVVAIGVGLPYGMSQVKDRVEVNESVMSTVEPPYGRGVSDMGGP
jgi:acyl CoA:acetate/3-ketoacid CoA transferase